MFTTLREAVKGRNLLRYRRAALCVDDERPPFSLAVLEAAVELSDDPDQLHRWATAIGGRYMGQDQAVVPGEPVVRIRPQEIIPVSDVAR